MMESRSAELRRILMILLQHNDFVPEFQLDPSRHSADGDTGQTLCVLRDSGLVCETDYPGPGLWMLTETGRILARWLAE
jgi:hypothetical protein